MISLALFCGVYGRETITGFIEQEASQRFVSYPTTFAASCVAQIVKLGLNLIPDATGKDCIVVSIINFAGMGHLANISAITQQRMEIASRESLASRAPGTIGMDSQFGRYVILDRPSAERFCRSKFEIGVKQLPDVLGLYGIDDQHLVANIISQRWLSAHPKALFLGGRNLISDPFRSNLPFELSKR